MKQIRYTSHLEFRLKIRKIPYLLPKEIYIKAEEHYYDRETNHLIALKQTQFGNKKKEMVIVYEENFKEARIITIHPLKLYQKFNRIKTGRWVKI